MNNFCIEKAMEILHLKLIIYPFVWERTLELVSRVNYKVTDTKHKLLQPIFIKDFYSILWIIGFFRISSFLTMTKLVCLSIHFPLSLIYKPTHTYMVKENPMRCGPK